MLNCLTASDKLGFLVEIRRITVALTRCSAGSTLVGNLDNMKLAPMYKKTLIYEIIARLSANHAVVDFKPIEIPSEIQAFKKGCCRLDL